MRNKKLQILIEGAVMVALATVLSLIKIYKLPWGGSVTLLSMLPIIVFSIRRGVLNGLGASFVYSLIQLGFGIVLDGLLGWGLTPGMLIACMVFDYIFAFHNSLHSRTFQNQRPCWSGCRRRYSNIFEIYFARFKRSLRFRVGRKALGRL